MVGVRREWWRSGGCGLVGGGGGVSAGGWGQGCLGGVFR